MGGFNKVTKVNAQTIREAFATLFGSRRIEDLKAELAEARKERDYFRGRADRLELMLLTPMVHKPIGPGVNMGPVAGRKPWAEVVKEDIERQKAELEKRKEAKGGN